MKKLVEASSKVKDAKDDKTKLEAAWPDLIKAAKAWKKGTTTAYTDEAKKLSASLEKEKKTFDTEMAKAQKKVDEQLKKDKKKEKENKALTEGTAAYKKGVDDLIKK